MSARVFIHPACTRGQPAVDIADLFFRLGFDMASLAVFHPWTAQKSNRYELVRDLGPVIDPNTFDTTGTLFARMNDEMFSRPCALEKVAA